MEITNKDSNATNAKPAEAYSTTSFQSSSEFKSI